MKMEIKMKIRIKGKKEFLLPILDEKKEVEILPSVESPEERSHDLFMRSRDLFTALKEGKTIHPSKDELEEFKRNLEFFIENDIRRSQEISVEDDINRKAKEYFGTLYKGKNVVTNR